ncbi:MAG: phosphatidylserine decarboxylase family protein [Nitrospiraceae bacterium]|nr:MAG: phosphatidylserine decarboxylase family protein [Nitrospiraceae bacterium]
MFQFAKEGYPFILIFIALTAVSALLRIHWLSAVFLILTLFMFYFFRDPERVTPPDTNAFYSPADGKVIIIGEAEENEILNEKTLKISIFMSPLNVHVNRAPCEGVVKEVKYFPGKFFNAATDEASLRNEHITMLLESAHGKIVVRQIAGAVARRAVCRAKPGEVLKQGQRYGIIKFSSRLDIFLPLNTTVKVKLGDKVKAGETVLGEI